MDRRGRTAAAGARSFRGLSGQVFGPRSPDQVPDWCQIGDIEGNRTRRTEDTKMEFIVVLAIMYFLPMIVAVAKGCDSKGAIILVSLLLGWFPLVSLICLFWAICGGTEKKQIARAKILADAIAAAQRA
jgi:hypothetical protein